LLKKRRPVPDEAKSAMIVVFIIEETIKTIQVSYNDRVVWLQKSLVQLKPYGGNQFAITIPFWLFTQKFPKLK